MGDTIDINVQSTIDEVTIIANPNNYIININRIIGQQVQSDWNQNNDQEPDYIKNKPTIPGAQEQSNWDETDSDKPTFIRNKPTIPTQTSELINNGNGGTGEYFLTEANIIPQVNSDWNATSGKAQILNKPTIPSIAGLATTTYVNQQDALKVDKVAGSRLITSAESTILGNTSGVNTGDQNLSNFVPYTGANQNVNLGTNDIFLERVFLNDAVNGGYASIHFTDSDFHIEDGDGHKMFVIEDGFVQLHKTDTIQSNLFTTDLTQTRDHFLPDQSGTIALTDNLNNLVPYTGANADVQLGPQTLSSGGRDETLISPSGISIVDDRAGASQEVTIAPNEIIVRDITNNQNVRILSYGIQFFDSTFQQSAFPPAGGTISQYIRGNGTLETFPTFKTINGLSVLGSGDLSVKGVHALVKPSAGNSVSVNVSTNAISAQAQTINRLIVSPFIPAQTITCSSLYINVVTLLLSSNAQILIYSNLNGKPDTKIYQSADLDCSTTGLKTATTTQTFEAGTTYWIGVHTSSTQSLTVLSTASLLTILITGTTQITGLFSLPTYGLAPTNFGATSNSSGTMPLVGIRI